MRTLVIGDIHGGLRGLIQVLDRAEISSSDKLIFLGDYVDGWSESAQLIAYLIELSKRNECVFIKGNHDVWCENWLADGHVNDIWFQHGGKETIESYSMLRKTEKQNHLDFFETMPFYHIDDENRLFVHAGFSSPSGVKVEVNKNNLMHDRSLWEKVLGLDIRNKQNPNLHPKRLKLYYEIYIGHTPTILYNKYEPINVLNVWNIDTGAAFTGKLSAVDIATKQVYQSDTLMYLYPNEFGRNK